MKKVKAVNKLIKVFAGISTMLIAVSSALVPHVSEAADSVTRNAWEAAACAAAGAARCGLAYTSSTAAVADTKNRFVASKRGDGQRGNAFQHASWNARMAVLIGRSWANTFSTAHERPLTSSNPSGTNQGNRYERMDLCNNKRGWNRPSNVEILTVNQNAPVKRLFDEAKGMSQSSSSLHVLLSSRSCNGTRLVYVKRDSGTWF